MGEAGREEAREEDAGDEEEKYNRVLPGARRAGSCSGIGGKRRK